MTSYRETREENDQTANGSLSLIGYKSSHKKRSKMKVDAHGGTKRSNKSGCGSLAMKGVLLSLVTQVEASHP